MALIIDVLVEDGTTTKKEVFTTESIEEMRSLLLVENRRYGGLMLDPQGEHDIDEETAIAVGFLDLTWFEPYSWE